MVTILMYFIIYLNWSIIHLIANYDMKYINLFHDFNFSIVSKNLIEFL